MGKEKSGVYKEDPSGKDKGESGCVCVWKIKCVYLVELTKFELVLGGGRLGGGVGKEVPEQRPRVAIEYGLVFCFFPRVKPSLYGRLRHSVETNSSMCPVRGADGEGFGSKTRRCWGIRGEL